MVCLNVVLIREVQQSDLKSIQNSDMQLRCMCAMPACRVHTQCRTLFRLRSRKSSKPHTSLKALSPQHISIVTAASTTVTLPAFLLMLAAPKARLTRRIAASNWTLVPPALGYIFLLVHSYQSDTLSLVLPGSLKEGLSGGFKPQFFPSLTGIATLFSRLGTAASLWLHLVAINLFAATRTYLLGERLKIPTRHTTFLCMVFGPLGLLSSILTEMYYEGRRRTTNAVDAQMGGHNNTQSADG